MTVKHEHSELPFHIGMNPGPIVYGPKGEQVADCRNVFLTQEEQCQNALFIARACNSHYELLEALTLALPYVETALEDQGYKPGAVDRMCKTIRQAIANATK